MVENKPLYPHLQPDHIFLQLTNENQWIQKNIIP